MGADPPVDVVGPSPNRLQPHPVFCLQLHGHRGRHRPVPVASRVDRHVRSQTLHDPAVDLHVHNRVVRLHAPEVDLDGNDVNACARACEDSQYGVVAEAVVEDDVVELERAGGRGGGGLLGELGQERGVLVLFLWVVRGTEYPKAEYDYLSGK